MGMCCAGTSGEPTDQGTCLEIGGDYYDDPSHSCLSGGLCAFLSALNEYLHERYGEDPIVLLAAGGTFTSLYDLRDEVLAKSDVGRTLLDHYREFAWDAISVARQDPDFVREALRVFLASASFGRAILREQDRRAVASIGERRFTDEAHKSVVAVLDRFRELAAEQGQEETFREPLAFLEQHIIEPFRGRTAREVLQGLMSERGYR